MRNNLLTRYLLRRNLGAAVLGMAVSTLNTVIDAFLMGNLLGPDALSAINLSMPLSYALVTVQCILAAGASLRVSKKLGERQNREADAIFTVSVASVFAAGLILMLNAYGFRRMERFFTIRLFRAVTVCALSFYALSKAYSFFTGANHLPSIITPGTPGMIFSAGLIPYLNISVGLVVCCTIYSLYTLFRKGDL